MLLIFFSFYFYLTTIYANAQKHLIHLFLEDDDFQNPAIEIINLPAYSYIFIRLNSQNSSSFMLMHWFID